MLAERALIAVNRLRPRPDAVVISGDLAECGLRDEYAVLADLLRRYLSDVPIYVIPGNHDRRELFREELAAFPGVTTHPEFVQYVVEDLPIRLVMLDTVVPGAGHGELCAARLGWLDATLAAAPTRATLLVMHHPPIICGIGDADSIRLRPSEGLAAVLARHKQVERILCGHHHRAMVGRFGSALVSVAPSVAHAGDFALTHGLARFLLEPPAFSVHVLPPGGDLVSHLVFVESYPGPFPYIDDPDYPGRPH